MNRLVNSQCNCGGREYSDPKVQPAPSLVLTNFFLGLRQIQLQGAVNDIEVCYLALAILIDSAKASGQTLLPLNNNKLLFYDLCVHRLNRITIQFI